MLIDTHVHLNDEQYNDQLDNVINESINYGTICFCVMGCDYESSLKAINIAKKYNGSLINGKQIECFAFVGIYPGEILKNQYSDNPDNIEWIKDLYLNNKDVVKGIGEIGIDLYWDKTYKEEQIAFFKSQLNLASNLNLPVSIHAREATQITLDILKEYKGKVKGVMHCYSGSVEIAKEIEKIGFKLGIGGVLTYKNTKLVDVINELDLSAFVTETDGPYLSPNPFRGKINKPGYIKYVVDKICEIKKLDYDTVEKILENNAREIFNLRRSEI